MDAFYLIAGLGNPGAEYVHTRHNAGFMAVEKVAGKYSLHWNTERKFNARVARWESAGKKVVLCQPLTYMNASGQAVSAVCQFYKVPPERLLVVMDDADLALGTVRLRASGSSGGHHGLESIESSLGSNEFARLKVGIGRGPGAARQISGYVLGKFGAEDAALLKLVLARVVAQVECYVAQGLQKAMNQFNGTVSVPNEKEDEK